MTDTERLDWLERNLRSTGRGNIALSVGDYNCPRVASFLSHYEHSRVKPFTLLGWPDTEGYSTGIREAIDAAMTPTQPIDTRAER